LKKGDIEARVKLLIYRQNNDNRNQLNYIGKIASNENR